MAGSGTGTIYRVTTWGESHGPAVGAVVEGCPAGISLSEEDIQVLLDRRKPGSAPGSTARRESDTAIILSGVFEGKTTGTPICVIVKNSDAHSSDYSDIADKFRPGHADYTYEMKYGIRDWRGGGRSSGRETVGRVIGGAIAEKVLLEVGISFETRALVKGLDDAGNIDVPEGDSIGGIVECVVKGVPAGLGDPVFEKLDAELAGAVFSIGAVKGFEIGSGFKAAGMLGSENNDAFGVLDGKIIKKTNNSGGILGGISDGSDIVMRAAIKPTPSISLPQETVDKCGTPVEIEIKGRHDRCIAPRAAVVVEAMAAITILDAYLKNKCTRL